MLTFSLSNLTNEDALREIKNIVGELIHAEDVYKAKFRTEKLHHVRQLVELIEERKDMEKLEAIKKIFEAYPYEAFSALIKDEEGDWVKNRKLIPMLVEIKEILEK